MTINLHQEAIGGLSAGILGTIIGYPLDLVKTRMQTAVKTENGMIQVGSAIFRREGFLALYKGMVPPLLSLSLLNTINFSSYSYFKDVYAAKKGWDIRNGLAGATVGPISGCISTLENFVKTQMQMDNIGSRKYKGSLHCVRSLIQSNGTQVLYTGHVVNTSREGVFLASYFYTYEGVRDVIINQVKIPIQVAIPMSGGISGAIAWFVSFPLDCIRAGIQGQKIEKGLLPKIRGTSIAKSLWQTKGLKGLYSGVTPTVVRAFLVSGSRFSAYELALWFLKHHNE